MRRPWRILFAVTIPIPVLALVAPDFVHDYRVREAIQVYGAVTTGTVQRETRRGGRGCRWRTEVAYHVQQRAYTLAVPTCGKWHERLPAGRAVEVVYLPASPASAIVRADDEDVTPGLLESYSRVAVLLGLCSLGALWEWCQWRRERVAI